jgi:hypothetical protein
MGFDYFFYFKIISKVFVSKYLIIKYLLIFKEVIFLKKEEWVLSGDSKKIGGKKGIFQSPLSSCLVIISFSVDDFTKV